jgi:PAB1-binding protein PBP1
MYTEEIRKEIYDKIQSNRKLLLELGKIVDDTLEENEVLSGVYGDDIIYNSMLQIAQVISNEIENSQY